MTSPALHTSPLTRVRSVDARHAPIGRGRAHAKAILFGEHAAVYGAPAVALPLGDLRATVSASPLPSGIRIDSALFRGPAENAPEHLLPVLTAVRATHRMLGTSGLGVGLRIRSTIPPERGLGSSAAVAAAVASAIADLHRRRLGAPDHHVIIQSAEQVAHGTPSGLDAFTVVADQPILLRDGRAAAVPVGAPLTFVLADSGVPGSTAEAVADVQSLRARRRRRVDGVIAEIAESVERGVAGLAEGRAAAVGAEMDAVHQHLSSLGVSTTKLDRLCETAVDAGALGAKLTGGGLGGCMIALAGSPGDSALVSAALREAGARRVWTVAVSAR